MGPSPLLGLARAERESINKKNKKLGAPQTKSEESGNLGDLDDRSLVGRLTTRES